MNIALTTIFGYGIPIGIVVMISIAAVVCMMFALVAPRYIVLGYLAILMLFSSTTGYGSLDVEAATNIYSRGAGTLFFPFLNIVVFGTWLMAVVFGRLWERVPMPLIPFSKYYLAFGVIFLGQVLVGLFDAKHNSLLDFHGSGVVNLFWQGMFVSLLVATIRTERDLRVMIWIMLACIAGREAFGLVRYVFFGGDPQNVYSNVQFQKVRVSFFDVNESVLAGLALGYCGWKLLADRVREWQWLFFAGLASMALLIPVLSSRRASQGGLLLAMAALMVLLPRGRRWPVMVAIAIAIPAAAIVTVQRSTASGGIVERLLFDIKTDDFSDPRKSRFYELETAWKSVRDEPVFGLGPSGSFRVFDHYGLEYHRGNYGFVHSGFGHIMLKSGIVGLTIFCGLLISYFHFVFAQWRAVPPKWRALWVGSVCAFMGQIPLFLIGTPVIEIRTMQLMGLYMVIPILVQRIASLQQDGKKHADEVNAVGNSAEPRGGHRIGIAV